MNEISEDKLAEIKRKMERGDFKTALNELIALINDDNYSILSQILEGILELQIKGTSLTDDQLEKIKPWIDDFDDAIQEYAVKIYSNKINKELNSIYNELTFLTSKLDDLEIGVKEQVVGFLIKMYYNLAEKEKDMIKGLISSLTDESWNVRMEIIRFLDEVLINKPNVLKDFENQLQVLYEEKDVDVKKEGLDLLLRLFIKTYSVEDLKKLIQSISENEWLTQENIIYLIGKLGIYRKDLIKPLADDLVLLLDDDDYLVRDTIKNRIQDILDHHEDLFDDAFFTLVENEEIDNLEAIEELLKFSIFKNNFERFYKLFRDIDPNSENLMKLFNNVLRKLNLHDKELTHSLISQLTERILKDLSDQNYFKLKEILREIPQDNIYAPCYQVLNEIDFIDNRKAEERRQLLLEFLLEKKPELSFNKVKKWLQAKLVDGPISIREISDKFNINVDEIGSYLDNIITSDELNAVISNDIIAPRAPTSLEKEERDLLFLKKWKVSDEYDIKLFIQIRNVSESIIRDLTIDLEYPTELFEISAENQGETKKLLEPNQSYILTYNFEKKSERGVNPEISNVKIIFNYEKNGTFRTIEKFLDVLLV
jgi:hypothetical protein